MANLLDFLIENPVDNITDEVIVSERLKEYPFKIKAMSGEEFTAYQKQATAMPTGKGKGKSAIRFNTKVFNELVILNHTIEPNFKNAEAIKKAGCQTPEQFLYKSLLAGEIVELTEKISTLSGFDSDLEDLVDEVKN